MCVFFLAYLSRELRRRMRQSIVLALGLALGVGLVITVTAASSGVRDAQADVLSALYGVGTDVTVTEKPPPPSPQSGGTRIMGGPNGTQVCNAGRCTTGAQTVDTLTSPSYGPIDEESVGSVADLAGVSAAVGELSLTARQMTIPAQMQGPLPEPTTFDVQGVRAADPGDLGPLSAGRVTSGREFTEADEEENVALVDANYAVSKDLKVGSAITIAKTEFTVAGLVEQPQGRNPPDVYVPLARAQELGTSNGESLRGKVNTIYVAAASAAGISDVETDISSLLPSADVTTAAGLADEVSGSLASTARLANQLGRWLSVLVLLAAFAVACLLTMSAVSRRVREFGTLKALGWRTRRIVGQVVGESVAVGVLGGVVGIGLGLAGVAAISAAAPDLSATVQTSAGQQRLLTTNGAQASSNPTVDHTVSVPLSPSVTVGGWRIAKMRPVQAMTTVA